MVYLIGVNHKIQHNGTNCSDKTIRDKFIIYLIKKSKTLNIKLIAEEFSRDALQLSKSTESTGQIAAREIGIEHRFCDPSKEERKAIGILSPEQIRESLGFSVKAIILSRENKEIFENEKRKYDPLREMYWLKCVEDKINDNIIFICGDDHLINFKNLIETNGTHVEILTMGWAKEI